LRRSSILLPVLVAMAIVFSAFPAAARSNIAVGWTVPGNGHDLAEVQGQVQIYVDKVGTMPKVWSLWSKWGDRGVDSNGPCTDPNHGCSFPSASVEWLHSQGITPMIWWVYVDPRDPWGNRRYAQYDKINKGVHDDYIKGWARALRDTGKTSGMPVIVRFAHENDGHWFAWSAEIGLNTPGNFKKAWARMWKQFSSVGANEYARWLWSPIVPRKVHFPGNKFVDYVGITALNPGKPAEDWKAAKRVINSKTKRVSAITRKPVIIAEMGTGHKGGHKGAWVRSAYKHAYWNKPQIRGIVYLDATNGPDWRLEVGDNGSGLTEYRKLAQTPKFKGKIR
jgi:mannan endo-1,4-beta-mannosidase